MRTSRTTCCSSRRCLPSLRSLLAVPLVLSLLTSYGCGTPVIKMDTSACNRAELTERGKDLPSLPTPDVRSALRNHIDVTHEYHALRNRHDGLAKCVEENAR